VGTAEQRADGCRECCDDGQQQEKWQSYAHLVDVVEYIHGVYLWLVVTTDKFK
jgi:hypothetical protein